MRDTTKDIKMPVFTEAELDHYEKLFTERKKRIIEAFNK